MPATARKQMIELGFWSIDNLSGQLKAQVLGLNPVHCVSSNKGNRMSEPSMH